VARGAELSHAPAVSNGSYDVARIREDFPILSMQVYGKPLVYLDNAASAQKAAGRARPLTQAYTSEYANVHRGPALSRERRHEGYEGAREKVRAFLNAEQAREIIFTRNATEAVNLVAYTFGRERIKPGDEIVLSIMEHQSNIVPWHFLRERQGAVIKWAPVDEDGNFLIDEFEKLLAPRTKWSPSAACRTRSAPVVPVERGRELCPCAHIPVLIDGAQAAVTSTWMCATSIVTFTSSPATSCTADRHRRAATASRCICRNAALQRRRRDDQGSVPGSRHYGEPPHKFEAGPADRAGDRPRAAIDYIQSIGMTRIRAHETTCQLCARAACGEINSLRIIGTAEGKKLDRSSS
jgi:cysteine desulfurase/selenocysteine lyase